MTDNNDTSMPYAAADSRQSTVSFNGDNNNIRSPHRDQIISGKNSAIGGTPATRPRLVKAAGGGAPFRVWPMTRDERQCNDIVHGSITIPPAVQVFLDTPPLQRTDSLRQLGCAPAAYPCTTHTRKSHSMGVMELGARTCIRLQMKQPQLDITSMDELCIRMGGLCHDLGHGPHSHCYEVFLAAVRKNESEHPEQYTERNTKFKQEFGVDMPPIPDNYEHEETSLMMIDSALAYKGLEIDWTNLDKPLKQIGNGIDATQFGVDKGVNEKGERIIQPFTSRDWVFIKECVYGKPLSPPHAPEEQDDFVGRDPRKKEFLFQIVNNYLNGLDVDKMDYYDRDSYLAYGSRQGNWNVLLRDVVVARATCPISTTCFKCKRKGGVAGEHLMLCYPKKHVQLAMNFFAFRMNNHATIYTHKKTKGAELQMVDLLVEADKHWCMLEHTQSDDHRGMPVPSMFEDFPYPMLPFSRVFMYPRLFRRIDDSIVSLVEAKAIAIARKDTENRAPHLDPLRDLIDDRNSHVFYKCAAVLEVNEENKQLMEFWELSEEDMKMEVLGQHGYSVPQYQGLDGGVITLEPEDIIVEKRTLHYGRKEKNPVSQMRFLESKGDQANLTKPIPHLPLAKKVNNLPMNTPQAFLRQTIRFFCRRKEKHELMTHAFQSWMANKEEKMDNPNCEYKIFSEGEEEEEEPSQQSSQNFLTQDDLPETQDDNSGLSPVGRKRTHSNDSPIPARKKLSYN